MTPMLCSTIQDQVRQLQKTQRWSSYRVAGGSDSLQSGLDSPPSGRYSLQSEGCSLQFVPSAGRQDPNPGGTSPGPKALSPKLGGLTPKFPALSSNPGALSSNPERLTSELASPTGERLAEPERVALLAELPAALAQRLDTLGKRRPPQELRDLVVALCAWRPCRAEELGWLLQRQPETVRQDYLRPLLRQGRIAMTRPDKPNDPGQAYRAAGVAR